MTTQKSILELEALKKNPLRLASIKLQNILGFEEFNLELGPKRTIVRGKNGLGKTTLIDTILNVLSPGSALASLQRLVNGEPEGVPEAVVVLKGDGVEEKRVTKEGSETITIESRVGNSAAFERLKQPVSQMRAWFDAAGANPVKIITAAPKEQMGLLLEALRLDYSEARVNEILGRFKPIVDAKNLPLEHLSAIQKVEAVHSALFDARKGVNKDKNQQRAAAEQTRRDTPAEIPEGLDDRIKETRAEVTELQTTHAAKKGKVQANYRATEQAAEADRDAAIAEAKLAFEKRMAAALAAASDAKAEVDALEAKAADANNRLTTLLRDSKDAERARTMMENAAKFDRDADSLEGEAKAMTAAMDALIDYRAEMASDIPIPGLTVSGKILEDGSVGPAEVRVGGIPFARLNTGQKLEIAVEIAKLRAAQTRLGLVVIDELQDLDPDHQEALFLALEKAGIQLVAGMVDGCPLKVERA